LARWSADSLRRRSWTGRRRSATVADDLRQPISAVVTVAEQEATDGWW
jgi:hypothetical protein